MNRFFSLFSQNRAMLGAGSDVAARRYCFATNISTPSEWINTPSKSLSFAELPKQNPSATIVLGVASPSCWAYKPWDLTIEKTIKYFIFLTIFWQNYLYLIHQYTSVSSSDCSSSSSNSIRFCSSSSWDASVSSSDEACIVSVWFVFDPFGRPTLNLNLISFRGIRRACTSFQRRPHTFFVLNGQLQEDSS